MGGNDLAPFTRVRMCACVMRGRARMRVRRGVSLFPLFPLCFLQTPVVLSGVFVPPLFPLSQLRHGIAEKFLDHPLGNVT